MLSGTANVDALAARAPTMTTLAAAPLLLGQVEVLQVMYEIASAQRQSLLPPGLHPTDPPLLNWLFYRCATSPWGSFSGVPEPRPIYPVSAALAAADITIPSIRFLCRPDVWAFEGTETVR